MSSATLAQRESNRLRDLQSKRVLDDAGRNRRKRKALEALDQDNHVDEPQNTAELLYRNVPRFDDELSASNNPVSSSNVMKKKRRGRGSGALGGASCRIRNRKTLQSLLEEEHSIQQQNRRSASLFAQAAFESASSTAVTSQNTHHVASPDDCIRVTNASSYFAVQVGASKYPARHFCVVCGFLAPYTCVQCGARYCSVRCLGTHVDTRCLKWMD